MSNQLDKNKIKKYALEISEIFPIGENVGIAIDSHILSVVSLIYTVNPDTGIPNRAELIQRILKYCDDIEERHKKIQEKMEKSTKQ